MTMVHITHSPPDPINRLLIAFSCIYTCNSTSKSAELKSLPARMSICTQAESVEKCSSLRRRLLLQAIYRSGPLDKANVVVVVVGAIR